MTTSNFSFSIETVIFAGQMASGLKEKLYGVQVNGSIATITKAKCDAEYKVRGQRDATLTTTSNVNCAINVDFKGRISLMALEIEGKSKKECFDGITKIEGDTFDCKNFIKDFGFSWDNTNKCWSK